MNDNVQVNKPDADPSRVQIFKIEVFIDETGHTIEMRTPVDAWGAPMGMSIYYGRAKINMSNGAQVDYQFMIEGAVDLRSAVERFDTVAVEEGKKVLKQIQSQAMKQALQIPALMPGQQRQFKRGS